MKNIKMILITAIAAMVLTGCGMNTIRENGNSYVEEISTSATIDESVNSYEESNIVNEDSSSNVAKPENNSSVNVSSSANEPVENPVESSTTTNNSISSTIEEKPISSSSTSSSTNKPVSSSSNKPVEKPVSSSTSSSSTNKPTSSSTTKIEEKPIHTHSFTEATCTNPATCISCGETKGTTISHNYNNGSCIYCGKNDPNYVAPHNCKNDGHIWNNSYTESSTENVEIVETHVLNVNGYDYDLAERYFGRGSSDVDFSDIFDAVWGSGSSKVKTTGVKTITRFIHECSECGYKEVYNTEETVTPDDNWVFVNKPRGGEYFPLIWWDINNIPDEVYEEMEAYNEYLRANGWPTVEIPAH